MTIKTLGFIGIGNMGSRMVPHIASTGISIHIYDLLGRKVRSAEQIKHEAGKHMFRWKGNNDFGEQVSSGIYFLHLSAGKESKRMKMELIIT